MPRYQVQLKQGKDVKTVNVMASNYTNVLAFFEAISTMKVFEIRKIEYTAPTDTIPIDDFIYHPTVKTLAHIDAGDKTFQMLFNNVKKTIDEQELFQLMKTYLEIDEMAIDSIMCTFFKDSVF